MAVNSIFTRCIDWAVGNRLLIVIALLVFSLCAIISLPKLNLDAFPDVTNIQVAVNTEAPGLASEEVEQLITFPIESVMYALPDVAEVRSISKTGISIVTIVFNEGVDIYFARQLVFERLQQAKELIPEGVGTPEIGPNTSGLGNIYSYILLAEPGVGYDAMALRSLNDWVVKLLLMPVDGVTDILSFGGQVRQYQVQVKPAALLAYKLSLNDISTSIEKNNRNAGGWYMDRGQEQLVIRGVGWVGSGERGLEDIRNIPIKEKDGIIVRVSDVASVKFGAEIRQGAVTMSRRNKQGDIEQLGEVVSGVILKRMGANTKATIDGIEERIALIQQALPKGVRFEPFYNQSQLIEQAVKTVVDALLIAFGLIVLIIALFLMNLRATILVLLSIPLSIGMALMVMAYLGMSVNLMSLGGLAVAIGMLVDGSVVMVENMVKHLSQSPGDDDQKQGADASRTAQINLRIQQAGREVARPTFFAASIILVVFAPIFSFEGVEAKLFQPMAISIMLAIVAAVIVALFVVPALATLLFTRTITARPSPLLQPIDNAYRKALKVALEHRNVVLGLAFSLLLGAASLLPHIGTEFVPELEEGTINLRATLAPSASLDTSLAVAQKLERQLLEFPEITWAFSRVGRAEIGGDPEPVNNIEIYLGLKPLSEWTSANNRVELQKLLEEKLELHPGLLLNFSQPIATRVDELLSGVKAQLAIKLFGPELDVLAEKGKEIEAIVQQIPGAVDVAVEALAGEAQLVIRPKRHILSRYGISVGEVMSLVESGIGGRAVGQVIQGNERYDIYLRYDESSRASIESIGEIRLQSASGAWLRLKDIASVAIESGPPQVRRDDVQRRVVIQANVQGRDMGSVVADIQAAIKAEAQLPAGYSVSIGGQFESQQRAQQRLAIVVPVSIALIALLLYFAFHSVGQALLILVNVPLALIGGIFSLYLGGQYLSVPSSVGFITLFGVAVLNGVVMVESINLRIEAGVAMANAVFEGATSRLRPVLMTALTSALGLIPMLLSTGTGAEIQKPLATVIVGGMVSATLLTLFVLPALYPLFSARRSNELRRG
jgi:cobalt-zinc-cadmium resistance protein CzcA